MIIVASSAIGIALLACLGCDFRRLVDLPIRCRWLIWLALVVQVVVLSVFATHVAGPVGDGVHLLTYSLAIGFVVINRRVPGIVIMGIGELLNLIAITANGGQMPASPAAWRYTGRSIEAGFTNSGPISGARLQFLGDVFATPAGWPLANVFSIGDVVLVAGLLWLIYRGCTLPRSTNLEHTDSVALLADNTADG